MDYGISCSPAQMRKLRSGGAVTMKPSNFDDGSAHRMMVAPATHRRIQTAMRKNKGVRVALKPDEDLVAMTEGGKVSLKSIGKALKKATYDTGSAYKQTGNVIKRGFDKKIVDSGVGKEIARQLIDVGTKYVLPEGLSALSMMAGDPTGMSGQIVGDMAGERLNALAARRGYGLFKTIKKVTGVNKKAIVSAAKTVGKTAVRVGAKAASEALTAYTGNPALGNALERVAVKSADRAIDSKNAKDILKNASRGARSEAKMIAVEGIDDYIDANLTGVEKDVAQKALAGKYPSASDLVYDYGNSKIEEMGNEMGGFGIPRRTRGGLRMGRGAAHLTSGYDTAMRSIRMGGAIPSGMAVADDRSVASMSAPSGDVIQTGSPYQRYASPAMSPFIAGSPQLVGQGMGGYGGNSMKPRMGSGVFKQLMGSGTCGGSFLPAGYRGGSFIPAGV
jgi:hypothetical protein